MHLSHQQHRHMMLHPICSPASPQAVLLTAAEMLCTTPQPHLQQPYPQGQACQCTRSRWRAHRGTSGSRRPRSSSKHPPSSSSSRNCSKRRSKPQQRQDPLRRPRR